MWPLRLRRTTLMLYEPRLIWQVNVPLDQRSPDLLSLYLSVLRSIQSSVIYGLLRTLSKSASCFQTSTIRSCCHVVAVSMCYITLECITKMQLSCVLLHWMTCFKIFSIIRPTNRSLCWRALNISKKANRCIFQNVKLFLQVSVLQSCKPRDAFGKRGPDQSQIILHDSQMSQQISDLFYGLMCLFMKMWDRYHSPLFSKNPLRSAPP